MYYVYVLLSKKDAKFYIGYTENLERRLQEHRRGETKSTKGRRPLVFIYAEIHKSEQDAKRREGYFKTAKGKSTLRQMLRDSLDKLD
jgi:putative endonuclease